MTSAEHSETEALKLTLELEVIHIWIKTDRISRQLKTQ